MTESFFKAYDLDTILDTVGALVVILDCDGRIVRFNRACERVTGFTAAEMEGQPIQRLLREEQRGAVERVFHSLADGRFPSTFENNWVGRDGREVLIAWTNTVLRDEQNRVRYVVGTGLDITARMQVERQLAERNTELEQANAELERLHGEKDEFLAMVSHELRTPLVTGLGYIDLLLAGRLGPVSGGMVARMKVAHKNLRRLSDLIDDILTYHSFLKVQFEEEITRRPLELPELGQECLSEFLIRRGRDPARVRLEIPDPLPPVVADTELLRMVFANLLDNADRHAGADAHIWISARQVTPDQVEVAVCDDGQGMEADVAARAFEPFIQAPGAREGSGLGLAIVRGILDGLGAKVSLDTAPGEGTRLGFTLEATPHERAPIRHPTPISIPRLILPSGGRVLVVDDDLDTLQFLELALETTGYEIRTAVSAEQALERLADSHPDLILLDLSLPGMDGVELCRRLKSNSRTAAIPILMFTARAEEYNRRRAQAAGCNGYLTKPVNTQTLLKTIQLILAEREEGPSTLE